MPYLYINHDDVIFLKEYFDKYFKDIPDDAFIRIPLLNISQFGNLFVFDYLGDILYEN